MQRGRAMPLFVGLRRNGELRDARIAGAIMLASIALFRCLRHLASRWDRSYRSSARTVGRRPSCFSVLSPRQGLERQRLAVLESHP
jgi:hypothetical protein